MSRQPVLLRWQLGNFFGWGVAGLNIFREWVLGDAIAPAALNPLDPALFDLGSADPARLAGALRFSDRVAAQLAGPGAHSVRMPVIHPLGNGLNTGIYVTGSRNIARAVFEDTRPSPEKLTRYDALVCCCAWNGALLRAQSTQPVHVIHEAVDHRVFYPRPPAGLLPPGRFYIFTGGKIEFRKAQDLTLLAFREFARRHDDAVLVTAWHSPWPQISIGFQGTLDAPLQPDENGHLDIARWVADNGIDPARVIDLGTVPNEAMPQILSEMHCALQPSRAEAGTNFVAMEAMACGLPVIVARNTGMHDLIADGNCVILEHQGRVAAPGDFGTEGWGESDLEEILEALETLYASHALRQRIGVAASAFMQTRTWAAHAEALKNLVLSV